MSEESEGCKDPTKLREIYARLFCLVCLFGLFVFYICSDVKICKTCDGSLLGRRMGEICFISCFVYLFTFSLQLLVDDLVGGVLSAGLFVSNLSKDKHPATRTLIVALAAKTN
jgi:hypothetical protein